MTPYEIAKGEVGVREIPGPEDNDRIVEYHSTTTLKATDDETSWCSSFVNWCVIQAGLKGTNSAAARSWLKWGMAVSHPIEGDIVIFKRGNSPTAGHVGFFVSEYNGAISVLGGNQSNKVGISAYKKDDVLGYRKPLMDNKKASA